VRWSGRVIGADNELLDRRGNALHPHSVLRAASIVHTSDMEQFYHAEKKSAAKEHRRFSRFGG
jgi:hypothetical protein